MDIFQELERGLPPSGYIDGFIQELNSMLSADGAIYSDPPDCQNPISNKWYAKPTQKEAVAIWDQCTFLSKASESMIESGLWEWALTHGDLEKKADVFYVHWKSATTKYSGTWSAFYKWFLCTLGPPIQ